MSQRFRVKVIPPCGDCHYFYADSLPSADSMVADLKRDLVDTGCTFFVYVDTRYGHVRVR